MIQSRRAIRGPLLARRHSIFLFSLLVLFSLRPFLGDTSAAAMGFSLGLIAVVLLALLTLHVDDSEGGQGVPLVRRGRGMLLGVALAVPAIVERLWTLYSAKPELLVVGLLTWLAFFCYVTWSQLRELLTHREVTGETISMSISIYLLLGMCFTLLYLVLFVQDPQSFSLHVDSAVSEQHTFPIFLYFSLTTLSTVGFGDITPVTLAARYAAVAEGIGGQFYLAIVVARLVGIHITQATSARENAPAPAARTEGPASRNQDQ